MRAFKTELKPNNKQRSLFLQHAGACRFVYNWALRKKIDAYAAKVKYPTAYDLNKELTQIKQEQFPWMEGLSTKAIKQALLNCDKAFRKFFDACKAKKSGKKGFPRFKSRAKGIGSFTLYQVGKLTNSSIGLPCVGKVRLKEYGYLPTDQRVISATVSEQAGHWFVSVLLDMPDKVETCVKDNHAVVGIDLGIKTLAVISDGQKFENLKPLKRNLRKLKHCQRYVSRKVKGSANRKKAVLKLGKQHYRIQNIRKDYLHKITTRLTRTKSVIVIEDLNVRGMVKNHKLAQAINDLGLYAFREMLDYKGERYGCRIQVADRYFPSSKRCSVCGNVNSNLALKDRSWACDSCGSHHDRDFNAARNLEQLAVGLTESINACGSGRAQAPELKQELTTIVDLSAVGKN